MMMDDEEREGGRKDDARFIIFWKKTMCQK